MYSSYIHIYFSVFFMFHCAFASAIWHQTFVFFLFHFVLLYCSIFFSLFETHMNLTYISTCNFFCSFVLLVLLLLLLCSFFCMNFFVALFFTLIYFKFLVVICGYIFVSIDIVIVFFYRVSLFRFLLLFILKYNCFASRT